MAIAEIEVNMRQYLLFSMIDLFYIQSQLCLCLVIHIDKFVEKMVGFEIWQIYVENILSFIRNIPNYFIL